MPRLVALGMINVFLKEEKLVQRQATLLRLIETAGRGGCQVVMLPEFSNHHKTVEAFAAYHKGPAEYVSVAGLTKKSPWLNEVAGLARQYRMVVIPNVLFRDGGKAYNRSLAFGPEGGVLGYYDKTHLPMGEEKHVLPGAAIKPIVTPFGKLGVLICYDINFPELTRCYELQGADILLWSTMRQGEHEHGFYRVLLPARAMEHRLHLGVATFVEEFDVPKRLPMCSAVFNPSGFMVAGGLTTEGVVRAVVDLDARPVSRQCWGKRGWVSESSYLRRSRRPELYGPLVKRLSKAETDLANEPIVAQYEI